MTTPTKTLFKQVIHQRGIHHELGITQNALLNLRRNQKLGKVSLDKMHEILEKAGYKKVQVTLWK